MGTQKFQMEYIQYLQERNNDLENKLDAMRESYEKKIFSRDVNKQHLLSLMKEILNVCTSLPQEIDLFFDEMSTAMDSLKNILLRKSEVVQLAEKITQALKPTPSTHEKLYFNGKTSKTSGTVKVSPMINGHVILTEPKIYVNRVSKYVTSSPSKQDRQELSPILEVSPSKDSDSILTTENHSQDRSTRRSRIEKRSTKFKDFMTSDISAKKTQPPGEMDPLEGPSWLYNDANVSNCFVNFRRRKQRFSRMFDTCNNKFNELRGENNSRKSVESNFVCSESISTENRKEKLNHDSKDSFTSKTPRKKSDGSKQKMPLDLSDYIEGTPVKTVNLKTMSKDEYSKRLSLKEPVVVLKDCQLDLNTRNKFFKSSSEANSSNRCSPNAVMSDVSFNSSNANKNKSELVFKCSESPTSADLSEILKGDNGSHEVSDYNSAPKKKRTTDSCPILHPINASSKEMGNDKANEKSQSECLLQVKVSPSPSESGGPEELGTGISCEESPLGNPWECTNSQKAKEFTKRNEFCTLYSHMEKIVKEESQSDQSSTCSGVSTNTFRQKRRAAPTNLKEPKLGTKLRRD